MTDDSKIPTDTRKRIKRDLEAESLGLTSGSWIDEELESAAREVASWPQWMRNDARWKRDGAK